MPQGFVRAPLYVQACEICLDELGGEGWNLQNNNCNKTLSHTVTPLGPCSASVIWSSLLRNLGTSKFIIPMRVKGKKKCSFPRWHVLNTQEICFVFYPITSKMSQRRFSLFDFTNNKRACV